MNKRVKMITTIFLLIAAGLAYWWYYHAAHHDLALQVIGVQGDVIVSGKPVTEQDRSLNAHGAIIEVKDGAIFNGKLEDGSYLQITENSQLTIAQAKRNRDGFKVRTRFVLDTGQVIRDIPKTETIGDYSSSLITTSVDIGIRGTRYAAIADKQQTRTMLYHGSVLLDSKGKDELILQENTGTITEKGKASQQPSELPPPPASLTTVTKDKITSRQFSLGWQAVNNATAYLVEIAEDADFRNLVHRQQAPDTQLDIEALPFDANFSWRVSTIDHRGLRGRPSSAGDFHYKYHHELVKAHDGEPQSAADLFDKALRGYPDDIVLIKDIGKYYYANGQYETALTYYNRALAIEPDNNELLIERGRGHRALGQQPEAERDFNNSLTIKTGNAEALWSLGNVEADKGNTQDSIEYYYRAIAAQPDHAKANLSAARAWLALGRSDKAHRHLMLHLENYPDDEVARKEFEQISLNIKNTDQGNTSK